MAGQLTLSTLSDGINSTSATNAIKGSAKAWVYFNGGASTIYSSYNVSSITRTTTGTYTINFTTAFPTSNICAAGVADYILRTDAGGSPFTTTTAVVRTINMSAALVDSTYAGVSFYHN